MSGANRYWFPAKSYGWGRGLPATWQGWIVLVLFAALVALGVVVFPPGRNLWLFIGYVAILVAGLCFVCYLKGEPPRWRWGGK